jgi:hypothetical protein
LRSAPGPTTTTPEPPSTGPVDEPVDDPELDALIDYTVGCIDAMGDPANTHTMAFGDAAQRLPVIEKCNQLGPMLSPPGTQTVGGTPEFILWSWQNWFVETAGSGQYYTDAAKRTSWAEQMDGLWPEWSDIMLDCLDHVVNGPFVLLHSVPEDCSQVYHWTMWRGPVIDQTPR